LENRPRGAKVCKDHSKKTSKKGRPGKKKFRRKVLALSARKRSRAKRASKELRKKKGVDDSEHKNLGENDGKG